MNLFDQGLRDEWLIAMQAVEQEVTVSNIWSQRDRAVLKATVSGRLIKASNDNWVWKTKVIPQTPPSLEVIWEN